jgi:hypothetical protein
MENKRDNSGVLFKSETREKESHPHYKGNITVAGVDYWISAWIKEGKNGKFMGLAVNPKEEKAQSPKKASFDDLDDASIPF